MPKDYLRTMEIIGVEIDGIWFLPYKGDDNSTGYYRAFMYHVINRYFDRILMTPELNKYFSLAKNDPMFKAAITYNRVEGYRGVYYSTYNGNVQKERRMHAIAKLLRIDLFVHTSD